MEYTHPLKEFEHPVLNKTLEKLLEECDDDSVIEPINIWLKNPRKSYAFKDYNYIAIEGNIGQLMIFGLEF